MRIQEIKEQEEKKEKEELETEDPEKEVEDENEEVEEEGEEKVEEEKTFSKLEGEQIQKAKELEQKVFGSKPSERPNNKFHGIYKGEQLIAVARVNEKPRLKDDWNVNEDSVFVSATAISPEVKENEETRLELYKDLQTIYDSIITASGTNINDETLERLENELGFKIIEEENNRTVYYWKK